MTGRADVSIRQSELAELPEEVVKDSMLAVAVEKDVVRLELRDFGRFQISGGDCILYQPLPGEASSSVLPTILGLCLGILLHQRGIFTLHASAVRHDEGCVAFVAHKGTGKSTTCANLHSHGYAVVTDDVLAITFDDDGLPFVRPAFPLVKLRPDSVSSLGLTPDDLPRLTPRYERRRLRVADTFSNEPLPLKQIYLLEDGDEFECLDLSQQQGFIQLLTHSYVVRVLGRTAATPHHFSRCSSIMKHVPVRRLRRPRDLSRMPELIDLIEADLAQAESEPRAATA